MKKREFNALLRTIATKATKTRPARLDPVLAAALPDATKAAMVNHIVRQRDAIVAPLLGPATDRSWLECCGYFYAYRGESYDFLGLAQHAIGRQRLPSTAVWGDRPVALAG